MAINYQETIDNTQPGNASFTLETARAKSKFVIQGPEQEELENLPLSILGDVEYDVGDGRLQRTLPVAHPQFPWLFASHVDVVGIGIKDGAIVGEKVTADPELEAPPITDAFFLYPWYEVAVEFTSRPFPVASDESISIMNGTWYYEGNPVGNTATTVTFPYCNEWERFTDFEIEPKEQAVQAQQGTMKFQSTDTSCVGSQIFPGQPRMTLPNQMVRFVWYQVPFRYVLSSNCYFSKWVGRINQNAWNGYDPGSLLYLGWKPRKYTPPTQKLNIYQDGVFSVDKWCNIEFNFFLTSRTSKDLPTAPSNKNFIQAGWNLYPWVIDRQYHFALSDPKSRAACSGKVPFPGFLSFPVEIMFFDPGAAGALDISLYP